MELEKDESFIPTPLLHSFGRIPGVSFEIDPETHDFMFVSFLIYYSTFVKHTKLNYSIFLQQYITI